MPHLMSINEDHIGSPTPLIWDETTQDFLAGKKPWDASGKYHMEGQQQDGTPWGIHTIQVGAQISKKATSILTISDYPTLH